MNNYDQRSLTKKLMEHLEDHDNADLPEIEWMLHMQEKVHEFNVEYDSLFHLKNSVLMYIEKKYKHDI